MESKNQAYKTLKINQLNATTMLTNTNTDRGSESKNELINHALETFEIKRSLSMKGNPYNKMSLLKPFSIYLKLN